MIDFKNPATFLVGGAALGTAVGVLILEDDRRQDADLYADAEKNKGSLILTEA